MTSNAMSRRRFLRSAALTSAVVGAGADAQARSDKPDARCGSALRAEPRWDLQADVVIVGFGGAGVSAAIAAKDLGADVLALEAAPERHFGGDLRAFGGHILSPDDVDQAMDYHRALAQGLSFDPEAWRPFVTELCRNRSWLSGLGAEFYPGGGADFPEFPGAASIKVYFKVPTPEHPRLWDLLYGQALKREIRVIDEAPAVRLVADPTTREVRGVLAQKTGREIAVRARRGVILACGGAHAPEQVQDICKFPARSFVQSGSPYNQGAGLRLAGALGAKMGHFAIVGPTFGFQRPGVPFAELITLGSDHFIWVGPNGKRFVAETAPGLLGDHGKFRVAGRYSTTPWTWPAYAIFDERVRRAGAVCTQRGRNGWSSIVSKDYDWSEDNRAEVERGWIKTAPSPAELAQLIGLDPATLESTVARWNEDCAKGVDTEQHRILLGALDAPPYYALPLTLSFPSVMGGPLRNGRCQIVDHDDQPIPRLYGAGTLGSFYPDLINTGGGSGEAMASGRLAARNVCLEPLK
jgi:succinate dehydrogenase/fumarate reductase flavoprotein subunit